jgi:hypothetical protein
MIKVPIYLGGNKHSREKLEQCHWAEVQFGADFVWQWELLNNKYWIVGNFRNIEDVTLFKLKFRL